MDEIVLDIPYNRTIVARRRGAREARRHLTRGSAALPVRSLRGSEVGSADFGVDPTGLGPSGRLPVVDGRAARPVIFDGRDASDVVGFRSVLEELLRVPSVALARNSADPFESRIFGAAPDGTDFRTRRDFSGAEAQFLDAAFDDDAHGRLLAARTARDLVFVDGRLHTTRHEVTLCVADGPPALRFVDRYALGVDPTDPLPHRRRLSPEPARHLAIGDHAAVMRILGIDEEAASAACGLAGSIPPEVVSCYRDYDFFVEELVRRHLVALFPREGSIRFAGSGSFDAPWTDPALDRLTLEGRRLLRVLQDDVRMERDTTATAELVLPWIAAASQAVLAACGHGCHVPRRLLDRLTGDAAAARAWWSSLELPSRLGRSYAEGMDACDAEALEMAGAMP